MLFLIGVTRDEMGGSQYNRLKKRAGGLPPRVDLELADLPTRMSPDQLVALDDALEKLKQKDPAKAQLVNLRYFAGMTIERYMQSETDP